MSELVVVSVIGGLVSLLGLIVYLVVVMIMYRMGGESALKALAGAMRAFRKGGRS